MLLFQFSFGFMTQALSPLLMACDVLKVICISVVNVAARATGCSFPPKLLQLSPIRPWGTHQGQHPCTLLYTFSIYLVLVIQKSSLCHLFLLSVLLEICTMHSLTYAMLGYLVPQITEFMNGLFGERSQNWVMGEHVVCMHADFCVCFTSNLSCSFERRNHIRNKSLSYLIY